MRQDKDEAFMRYEVDQLDKQFRQVQGRPLPVSTMLHLVSEMIETATRGMIASKFSRWTPRELLELHRIVRSEQKTEQASNKKRSVNVERKGSSSGRANA